MQEKLLSLFEIKDSLDYYDINYVSSNPSIKACINRKIGDLIKNLNTSGTLYNKILNLKKKQNFNSEEYVTEKLSRKTIDASYYFKEALLLNCTIKEIHKGEQANKDYFMKNYYLEDGFNDNIVHFNLALERQNLNSGYIDQQIKELNDNLANL
jgi:hypothetical protein